MRIGRETDGNRREKEEKRQSKNEQTGWNEERKPLAGLSGIGVEQKLNVSWKRGKREEKERRKRGKAKEEGRRYRGVRTEISTDTGGDIGG